ncbi:hypothetical protein [Gordonia sp. ABSL49_1]|uniref:hypothetical protein n=1 Tax=Gordonia sp. ABSL49_1 TaxID=2920941 RepID=UPI001F0F6915|nr:hypothetical protein [Gordonia sp. ABSL49_1]MCH5641210.1 hypothetical protein [Gordonia sp. ABSL49_1]
MAELSRRRVLWGGAIAVVAAVFVVVTLLGRDAINERAQDESQATERCTSIIRGDIAARLEAGGTSSAQASSAEFSGVTTDNTGLYATELNALREARRDRSTVANSWEVSGTVRIQGDLPSGSGLGPTNTFRCTAVVFNDRAVLVASHRIN